MQKAKSISGIILVSLAVCCSNSYKGQNADSQAGADPRINDGSVPAVDGESSKLPLGNLKLPRGFSIAVYAEIPNARQMALSPSGTLFVGNNGGKGNNKVYAVKDTDGDGVADKKWVIASGLNAPNGVAFKDGDLYVGEISRVTRYSDIENKLGNPGTPTIVNDKFPTEDHHGAKYIAFGPDGKLYIPVGAPCNICEPTNPIFAAISRMNPDGSGLEVFAHGVRNTVGLAWHPETRDLWFTDNGRDMLGDDIPSCELNSASKPGMHFGYPYCHAGNVKDPEYGNKRPCSDFTAPAQNLGAHIAPLGLKFYTGNMFPSTYKNQIFLAEHGSWNRAKKSGYNISLVKLENSRSKGYEPFITGWLNSDTQEVWGRPVDVMIAADGAMLVSDDTAGVIYRITYKE